MSWPMLLAPRRLARLFAADVMNVTRDPMLAFATALSLMPSLALHFFGEAMDAAAQRAMGIETISALLAPVALVLPATLTGWVTGFLLLEDRDDGPLLAIDVTPLGKLGFVTYRVLVTALLTAAITAMAALLLALEGHILATVVMVAAEAVIAASLLPALARNKVEGLALTKLTNIMAVVPLLALIPSPWRLLAGVVPSYWLGELMLGAGSAPSEAMTILIGAAVHAAWLWAALWLFSRKVG